MICRMMLFLTPLFFYGQSTDVPTGVRLTPPANVPATLMDRFRVDFPKANASWSKHGDSEWLAVFNDDSTQLARMMVYDLAGNPVEGKKRMEKGAYPNAIDRYFHTHHPAENYEVWRYDGRDSATFWFAVRDTDTTWFRNDGSYSYQRNIKRSGTLADQEDVVIIQSLWGLNQQRMNILQVAEKNGFVTSTRQQHAESFDKALRNLASSLQLTLAREQDEKEKARIENLSKEHGERLARSVNRELQKVSAEISRELSRAGRSGNKEIKALEQEFGGPDR